MKLSLTIAIFLLPYAVIGGYDESSPHKIKLEDIEDEHVQNERHSKAHDPQSMPPPLSKQPAKGQPIKLHPSVPDPSKSPSTATTNHHYTTRAEQHVQPLTDQPNPPTAEADYQQSPTYQRETIVYVPSNAQQSPTQQQYDDDEQQQQPSPAFYYSHDASAAQQQELGNGYQLQFVPIDQHGGSGVGQAANQVEVQQKQESAANDIQRVHGLSAGAFYDSGSDIKYASPAVAYGTPSIPQQTYAKAQETIAYSQQASYANEQNAVDYTSLGYNQGGTSLTQNYVPSSSYYPQHRPAVTYGHPNTVDQTPHIQYGSPDAPFRRPKSQSNQSVFAPRRPEQAANSNEASFAVSFPYPPSFISITTERPLYEKAVPEPAYNEIPQWQTNVMSLHLVPPQETQYQITAPTASPVINQHLDLQPAPLFDVFHSRQAKSLLDSYIPSWLVFRVQEEHARRYHQQQQQLQEQAYAAPTAPSENAAYNTVAYSSQYDSIYGKDHKRSITRRSEGLKKKATGVSKKTASEA